MTSAYCPAFTNCELKQILTIVKRSRTRKIEKQLDKTTATKAFLLRKIQAELKYQPPIIARKPRKKRESSERFNKKLNIPFMLVNIKNNGLKLVQVKAKGRYRLLPKTEQIVYNSRNYNLRNKKTP